MARPAALGSVVVVASLADADLVLAELSYLGHLAQTIETESSKQIDAIKTEAVKRSVVTVEGTSVPIQERCQTLETVLTEWMKTGLLLVDNKKSIELAHGTIGFRQTTLTMKLADEKKAADVVDAINEISKGKRGIAGWIDGTYSRLAHLVKGLGNISDYLTLSVSLNMAGIKKAYKDKRVKADALAAIHLVPVDPIDAPFITPAEYVVKDA